MNFLFRQHIEQTLSNFFSNSGTYLWQPISGGSINNTYKISTTDQHFFVKLNTDKVFENGFKEEVLGLLFLEEKKCKVPKRVVDGIFQDEIYLVLEWIDSGSRTIGFWKSFAGQLADLHQHTSKNFGLNHNNYMGQLLQKNDHCNRFTDFFILNRLMPQVNLAMSSGLLQSNHVAQFDRLYKELPNLLPSEKPAAVHGDLWSGNFMCDTHGKAVLIDPAVYYGHREVDLAMSLLFGGFSNVFYNTYQEVFPLEKNFEDRKDIYNLYPLLIHLNLFGRSYLSSIEKIVSKF